MRFNRRFVYDRWSWWHTGLWGGLSFFLLIVEIKPFWSVIISIFIGLLWEIKDGLAISWSEWDPRKPEWAPLWLKRLILILWPADGFSWSDLIFDSIGITIALLMFKIFGG